MFHHAIQKGITRVFQRIFLLEVVGSEIEGVGKRSFGAGVLFCSQKNGSCLCGQLLPFTGVVELIKFVRIDDSVVLGLYNGRRAIGMMANSFSFVLGSHFPNWSLATVGA